MKKTLIIGAVLVVLIVGVLAYIRVTTKSHSPEGTVDFTDGSLKIHVFYNRPFKRAE